MDFQELNTLQKYCDNVIDQEKFMDLSGIYDYEYGAEKFKEFLINPIRFLTSRNEGELFLNIQQHIKADGFTG